MGWHNFGGCCNGVDGALSAVVVFRFKLFTLLKLLSLWMNDYHHQGMVDWRTPMLTLSTELYGILNPLCQPKEVARKMDSKILHNLMNFDYISVKGNSQCNETTASLSISVSTSRHTVLTFGNTVEREVEQKSLISCQALKLIDKGYY